MDKIKNWFKKLYIRILLWLKPPKIGQIQIEVPETQLQQDVRSDQQTFDVNLDEWKDAMHQIFETNNFVGEGGTRPIRPDDEILKQQIQLFYKDYRKMNQKTDQLYTKNMVKCEYDDIDNS